MNDDALDAIWPFRSLGNESPADRGAFYDELQAANTTGVSHFFGGSGSSCYESQVFRIGLLSADNTIVPAAGHRAAEPIRGERMDVYLNRFFVAAMPGRKFKLQLFLGANHDFDNNRDQIVGHTYAVQGVLGDYANLMNEPVFRRLKVADLLKLRIGVNFVSDSATDTLLSILQADAIRKGIDLTNDYNPAYGAIASFVHGLTIAILKSRQNKTIITTDVTLKSTVGGIDQPLAVGTYVLIQVPIDKVDSFDWSRLRWNPQSERLCEIAQPLDWNYLMFRIEKSQL